MSMHELKQMAPPVLSEMEGQPIYRDKDDLYLTRMGKRPVLKVRCLYIPFRQQTC